MKALAVEIKAKCTQHEEIRKILKELKAEFKGVAHQVDTYFRVPTGRLKYRESEQEQHLIYYLRQNISQPKESRIILFKTFSDTTLKEILTRSLGISVVVDKMREVYQIENVKFHLDQVKYLGTFVEIEAIDYEGTIGRDKLQQQCDHYLKQLNVNNDDLLAMSYSDLLREQASYLRQARAE